MTGTIVKGIGGFYYVREDVSGRVYQCRARGVFKKDGITPTVGDNVSFEIPETGDAWITAIADRKNVFIRPPVSNIDMIIVITAAKNPKPNLDMIDRLLVAAEMAEAEIVICINKMDLAGGKPEKTIGSIYEGTYRVIHMSCLKDEDAVKPLKDIIAGKRVALAGPSGVGKSTILNLLLPEANAQTGDISEKTQRGRHTTRHVEIFELQNGAMVYDTPGFTSFEISEIDENSLDKYYPEIESYIGQCRYADCNHLNEPGCAVKAAVEEEKISLRRYESYKARYEEIKDRKKY